MNTSEMATEASKLAIQDAGIDPETIDQIIVAHNFETFCRARFKPIPFRP